MFLLLSVSCVRIDHIQDILSDADSLRSVGKLYPDSSQLDSVVSVLKPVRYFYPDEYAAANYYYGRVLRDRNNQLEAMRCFINATHSNTTDYALLGRVYSNMGAMCAYSSYYDHACELFLKADKCFVETSDTLAQHNAICSLALANAQRCNKEKTMIYLNKLSKVCNNPQVLSLADLAHAILYKKLQQNDSALYYVNRYLQCYKNEQCGMLAKAQILSNLGKRDSALFYADFIMKHSQVSGNKYNALYILSHDDSTIDKDSILKLTSDREDVNNHELKPIYVDMAQAVQLLEQDLEHKPNYLLYILCSLAVCLTILFIFIRIRMLRIKKEKDSDIQKFNEDNHRLESNLNQMRQVVIDKIESTCTDLQGTDLAKTISWNDYEAMCLVINSSFNRLAEKLRAQYNLNEKEVRLCVLTLIDDKLSGSQMSNLLIYSEKSVRGLRSKTAKKLNTDGKQFRNKLLEIVLKTA